MNVKLVRDHYRSDGIFSRLLDPDGAQIAVTLEHAYPDGAGGWQPKIPQGLYQCVRGKHILGEGANAYSLVTFEVLGIEGHSGLLFHNGNYFWQTKGCVLVGEKTTDLNHDGHPDITNSVATFNKFMALQEGVDEFELEVA